MKIRHDLQVLIMGNECKNWLKRVKTPDFMTILRMLLFLAHPVHQKVTKVTSRVMPCEDGY